MFLWMILVSTLCFAESDSLKNPVCPPGSIKTADSSSCLPANCSTQSDCQAEQKCTAVSLCVDAQGAYSECSEKKCKKGSCETRKRCVDSVSTNKPKTVPQKRRRVKSSNLISGIFVFSFFLLAIYLWSRENKN